MKEVRDSDLQLAEYRPFKAQKRKCKGPGAGLYLVYLRYSEGTSMAGELRTRGGVVGDTFREVIEGSR